MLNKTAVYSVAASINRGSITLGANGKCFTLEVAPSVTDQAPALGQYGDRRAFALRTVRQAAAAGNERAAYILNQLGL